MLETKNRDITSPDDESQPVNLTPPNKPDLTVSKFSIGTDDGDNFAPNAPPAPQRAFQDEKRSNILAEEEVVHGECHAINQTKQV